MFCFESDYMPPFGFEQREKETAVYEQLLENKTFLEVTAMMCTNKDVIPLTFKWDYRQIKIDRVINVREGVSLKDGFCGKRYLCQAEGKRFYLYFTGRQWYMNL